MVLIDLREKQEFDWVARYSTSYWYNLVLTSGCDASVSLGSTLRDRSIYLSGELIQILISLPWLSH